MRTDFRRFKGIDFYTSGTANVVSTREVAQWSDEFGCRGMLVYTDNRSIDPWILAQDLIIRTTNLAPLIALQPVYMHPYAAAQKVFALAHLYGRPVDINFVAGGFQFDLTALGDRVHHDARYERLAEYGTILTKLLTGERITIKGQHYSVSGLQLAEGLPVALRPRLTVAGSSPSGRECAATLAATAVTHPAPLDLSSASDAATAIDIKTSTLPLGVRIGILTRETNEMAWREAHRWLGEIPQDKGQMEYAVSATDSSWLKQLAISANSSKTRENGIYWLGPFERGVSFCPYLVGSYDEVAHYLHRDFASGVRLIILDTPREKADLEHIYTAVLRSASEEFV
jgi:alkanesulfonate monooxygenase